VFEVSGGRRSGEPLAHWRYDDVLHPRQLLLDRVLSELRMAHRVAIDLLEGALRKVAADLFECLGV